MVSLPPLVSSTSGVGEGVPNTMSVGEKIRGTSFGLKARPNTKYNYTRSVFT